MFQLSSNEFEFKKSRSIKGKSERSMSVRNSMDQGIKTTASKPLIKLLWNSVTSFFQEVYSDSEESGKYLSFSYLDIFTEFAEFTEFYRAKMV